MPLASSYARVFYPPRTASVCEKSYGKRTQFSVIPGTKRRETSSRDGGPTQDQQNDARAESQRPRREHTDTKKREQDTQAAGGAEKIGAENILL